MPHTHLQATFHTNLPATLVMDYPTAASISALITQQLQMQVVPQQQGRAKRAARSHGADVTVAAVPARLLQPAPPPAAAVVALSGVVPGKSTLPSGLTGHVGPCADGRESDAVGRVPSQRWQVEEHVQLHDGDAVR